MGTGRGSSIAASILRLSIGGTMIAHGLKHAQSLDGTARWFGSIGFKKPDLQARLSAVVEIASGGALLLGAATPLAASAVIGTMAVAAESVHRPNGFFITSEGYEYVLALSAGSSALAALGGGRFSVDRLFGLEDRLSGLPGAALAFVIGFGGAAAQLAAFYERPPEPAEPAA